MLTTESNVWLALHTQYHKTSIMDSRGVIRVNTRFASVLLTQSQQLQNGRFPTEVVDPQ